MFGFDNFNWKQTIGTGNTVTWPLIGCQRKYAHDIHMTAWKLLSFGVLISNWLYWSWEDWLNCLDSSDSFMTLITIA